MNPQQTTLTPVAKGRKRKYFFQDLIPGGSQEYTGKGITQDKVAAAAYAYSKKFQNGSWKFSCRTGTRADVTVITVTRTE